MSIFDYTSLTPKQAAKFDQPLPDVLSFYDIVELWTDDEEKRQVYLDLMWRAAIFDFGDRWKLVDSEQPTRSNMLEGSNGTYRDIFLSCLDFCKWVLDNEKELPSNCLLEKWWCNNPSVMGFLDTYGYNCPGVETGEGALFKGEATSAIDTNSLLNLPSRQDDWVDVINDMTKAYHAEFGQIPNEAQAWGQLCENPPKGYLIENGEDRGEDCLTMPGVRPLNKSSFSKRWKKYTSDKLQ